MTRMSLLLLVLFAFVPALPALAAGEGWTMQDLIDQPGVVSAEYVFNEAPFAECHASTIAQTPSGLVVAWFGGTHEKNPDVGIWLSQQRPVEPGTAGRWTLPETVADGIQYRKIDGSLVRYPCWNPVLFQPPGGPLMLFYKCGPDPAEWWGMLMTSADDGATWSLPRRLPEGILGPVKNKPVLVADGTLVCPSSTEDHGWRLHMEFTRDLGATWSRTPPLNNDPPKGAIQPSILFHPDGRWQLIARDHRKDGNLWTAWSRDQGKTWTELASTGLPNPSAGADAVTLADGRQLLVYNHTHGRGPNVGQSRTVLNVAVSDDGIHWQAALVLERAPGEYSYPAVIQAADGLVHVTYTWRRQRIKHVVIDPAQLVLKPIVDGRWPQ
jgi:predicted neuraminidase